jgi:cytochrome oxidase assembly protein ShyY1
LRPIIALLRQPRWAIGAVIVVAAAVGFALAGLWQLSRLEERRDRNREIVAAAAAPVLPLELPMAEYTKVRASGVWIDDAEVSLPLQTRAGEAGVHLLTPLSTDSGIFLVDRGWVPLDAVGDFPRATGTADVIATVRLPRSGSATGGSEGGRPSISRRDPEAVSAMTGLSLEGIVLELISETPATDPAPLPPVPAPVGEGNHLLYAIQWFSFIAIAVIGYGALLRRNAASALGKPGDQLHPR